MFPTIDKRGPVKAIIILGVVGASLSAIFARLSDAPSMVLVFYRMFFAVVLLLPSLIKNGISEYAKLEKKNLILCVVSGLFLGLHFSFYFESLKHTSIASSVVLVDTEVFFVAMGSLIFLKEKISKVGWLCILVTFIGSVIVSVGDAAGGAIYGDILALLGAVCVGIYTLIGRQMRKVMSTTGYTWIVYLIAALVVLIGSSATGNYVIPVSFRNILCGLGLTVFCTLLGHSIFSWGLKYEKAAFVSTAKLLEPVFAAILGLFIFAEVPSVTSVIGGIMIIVGIVFMCREESKVK